METDFQRGHKAGYAQAKVDLFKEMKETGVCATCGKRLTRHKLADDEKEKIRRLRKRGVQVKEIAKAYHRNPATIWRVLNCRVCDKCQRKTANEADSSSGIILCNKCLKG